MPVRAVEITEFGQRTDFDYADWLEGATDEQIVELHQDAFRASYAEMIPGQTHCPSGMILVCTEDAECWIRQFRPGLVGALDRTKTSNECAYLGVSDLKERDELRAWYEANFSRLFPPIDDEDMPF
jgi:hypothetical protein